MSDSKELGTKPDVDVHGNCSACGGIHYGTGPICAYKQNHRDPLQPSSLIPPEGVGVEPELKACTTDADFGEGWYQYDVYDKAERDEVLRGPCCRDPWCEEDCTCELCASELALERAKATIAELESELASLREAGEWVSVEDKFPPVGVRVLMLYGVEIEIGAWSDEDKTESTYGVWWGDQHMLGEGDITHWRPLPPAPPGPVDASALWLP
jgi:hypothetical protein